MRQGNGFDILDLQEYIFMDNETKQEFDALRREVKDGFVTVFEQFAEQRAETNKQFAEQKTKIFSRFHEDMAELLETAITPQFEELRGEIVKMRNEMVTKNYLDDKLADLEGGMVSKLRKEDNKVNRLLKLLETKNILSVEEARSFDEYQIFPRLPVV